MSDQTIQNSANPEIVGYYVIKSTLITQSPLVMGDGEGDEYDKIVLKDAKGAPYISSTAFTGCLKSCIKENFSFGFLEDDKTKEYFWGSDKQSLTNSENSQSHLRIFPLKLSNGSKAEIAGLDGIRIDHKIGIVVDGAKYNYEAINNEVEFDFHAEIQLRKDFDVSQFEAIIGCILDVFAKNKLRLGAFTSTGYGKVVFQNTRLYKFDFTENDAAVNWFEYKITGAPERSPINPPVPDDNIRQSSADFKVVAVFKIKTALISGFGNHKALSDKSHYVFNSNPALTGKSIKGAINHRLWKIIRTISNDLSDEKCEEMYGWLGWGNEEKEKYDHLPADAKASNLRVEFSKISNCEKKLQDRVKIDRFTQGAVDTAKFDSEPIWSANRENNFKIEMTIKQFKPWQAALLLHVLKDLWTGDLPIGGEKNVGRGVLIGKKASIAFGDNNKIIIETESDLALKSADFETLNNFQTALNAFVNGK